MQYTAIQKNMKPGTPQVVPSKAIIINWVRSLFPELPQTLKIQDFGQGVIYARILNHYHGNPLPTKITWSPKNQYQYSNNLRYVQAALTQLGITIPLDVNRIAKCKFLENWTLVNGFYRHFHQTQQSQNAPEQNSVSSQNNQKKGEIPHKRCQRPPPIYSNQQTEMRGMNRSPSFTSLTIPNKQRQYMQMNSQISSLAQSSLHMTSYLKQNVNFPNSSPNKGKWSVGSQMLQNNSNVVIDRIKQILLKGSQDSEKVRQIKMLLGMPFEEEDAIKIEDDDNGVIVYGEHLKEESREHQDCNKESVGKLSGKKVKKPFKI